MTEARARAAAWIAEAVMTGDALPPLPAEVAPRTVAEGDAIAALVLETMGLAPCGVRLAPGPDGAMLAGPMLEGRLLRTGTTLPTGVLRHARATAAVVGVLAEDLDAAGDAAPLFSAVHAAIDLAGSRFGEAPTDSALVAADLGGLGHVVVGRPATLPAGLVAVSLGPEAKRPRGRPVDVAATLEAAAVAAREAGGLPAGALLVVAGLSPADVPRAGETLATRVASVGRATLHFA